jgi:hypothetical protein
MKLQPTSTTYTAPAEILASDHYQVIPGGVTIDASSVASGTYAGKVLPAGTPMAEISGSGLYGPYASGATDGRQVFVGLLFYEVDLSAGNDTGSILIHAIVKEAALPEAPTATTKSENGAIRYV